MISIKTNIAKIINTELKDLRKDINKATRSSNLKVARQGANAGKKAVRETYTIPTARLNEAVTVKTDDYNTNTAKIIVQGRKISLAYYRAIQSVKKGVTVMIIKGKRIIMPGKNINKTFIATTKAGKDNSYKGVFFRISNKRLPIETRVGPSAVDLMRSRKAYNAIKDYVKINYERIYNSEYNYFKKK